MLSSEQKRYIHTQIIKRAFAVAGYDLSDSDCEVVVELSQLLSNIQGDRKFVEKTASAYNEYDRDFIKLAEAWIDEIQLQAND